MAGGRDAVKMTDDEIEAFLDANLKVQVATVGKAGEPHLTTLFYVVDDGKVAFWTYGRSQKIRNLERDPRATLLTEAGTSYQELRGVSMECDAELVRDPGQVLDLGVALAVRYGAAPGPELRAGLAAQAAKRVGIRFRPTRGSSWDHRKLG